MTFQPSHARILCALSKNKTKAIRLRQLMLVVSVSVMYRRMEQLVELGFVKKIKVNRKQYEYRLTEKGRMLAALLEEFEQCTSV